MSKRSLSTSYLEDQWLEGCVEVGDGTNQKKAARARGGQKGGVERDTGESTALKTLNDLKCIVTLGVEIAPSLPSEKMAVLVVLLLTICTQELVLYGVHSTPQVELERQRTLNFILQEGRRALAQLEAVGQSYQTLGQGREILQLLEEFRTPQKKSNSKALALEATISSYRIEQCKEALQQLQSWIQSSVSIPEEVAERALNLVSLTRHLGKARLKMDANAGGWVASIQAQLCLFAIAEQHRVRRPFFRRLPAEEEIAKYQARYEPLTQALARSIQTARKHQPVEHQGHVYGDQQQQKDNQTLHEQQHPSTSHISDNNDDSRPTPQPAVDQPAAVTTDAQAHALHHPPPLPVPRQGPLLTTSNTLVNLPLLDPTQSSPADSQQNIPIAQAERWEQSPPHSTPSGYELQQAAMAQERSMLDCSTANSILRANAPLHTTIRYRHQAAGGDQGDAHLPSTHNLVDLDPLGPLVAEALSSALSDSDSPTGSGQGPHRDQGWP
ncbi:hypothetical protein EMWEY_00055490 [Eimeria maxima]|uniref:Uncharacterized protein n=1 Tax=Eimeria maxima TaxID=5804 RepID=U6M4Z0_EIMMA|nr:hypothetical protein EMWEY_00055490 [Eimeria maxima]CDJ59071.1 hypothetical protein EMWEY_00055490 [Eimeria maxima]